MRRAEFLWKRLIWSIRRYWELLKSALQFSCNCFWDCRVKESFAKEKDGEVVQELYSESVSWKLKLDENAVCHKEKWKVILCEDFWRKRNWCNDHSCIRGRNSWAGWPESPDDYFLQSECSLLRNSLAQHELGRFLYIKRNKFRCMELSRLWIQHRGYEPGWNRHGWGLGFERSCMKGIHEDWGPWDFAWGSSCRPYCLKPWSQILSLRPNVLICWPNSNEVFRFFPWHLLPNLHLWPMEVPYFRGICECRLL